MGVSYNTFVWDRRIDPHAGMLRLVLGLGTRAVDRVSDDYPRIVSLDHPLLVAHADQDDAARFSQHQVDVLNISRNAAQTVRVEALANDVPDLPWHLLADEDPVGAARQAALGRGAEPSPQILSFSELLGATAFPAIMRRMLATLERAYDYPVDVEFTADVSAGDQIRVNLVQCRPLQTRGIRSGRVEIPAEVPAARTLFRSSGSFMGGSIVAPLRRVIYVDPQGYTRLREADRHEVARLIGRLTRHVRNREDLPTALLGPGRWGTSSPSMGVPVRFAELRNVTVLGEIAFSAGGLMPELSFGSHFFQDLVESGIFYVALFPEREGTWLNLPLLEELPNQLPALLPQDAALAHVVRVVDLPAGDELLLQADILSQQVLCHRPTR